MDNRFNIDPTLLDAIIDSTTEGLSMAGITPSPVGVNRVAPPSDFVSCIVGLGGAASGTLSLNASTHATIHVVNSLLEASLTELNDDVLDGIMEIGNIIAGCLKAQLDGGPFQIDQITLPSIVFGANHGVYHARNITTVTVKFELPGLPARHVFDRYFSTTVALLRTNGS